MKKKLLIVLFLITSLMIGCNKEPEDTTLMEGQEKLESHQYDEALTLLSQVLDEDPQNDSARAMYMQARKMKSAETHESNNNIANAIRDLEAIVNIDNGSNVIKRESINKKAELEKLQEEEKQAALERKENAKKTSRDAANRNVVKKSQSQAINNNKVEKQESSETKVTKPKEEATEEVTQEATEEEQVQEPQVDTEVEADENESMSISIDTQQINTQQDLQSDDDR